MNLELLLSPRICSALRRQHHTYRCDWGIPVSYTHLDVYKRQVGTQRHGKTQNLTGQLGIAFAAGRGCGGIFSGKIPGKISIGSKEGEDHGRDVYKRQCYKREPRFRLRKIVTKSLAGCACRAFLFNKKMQFLMNIKVDAHFLNAVKDSGGKHLDAGEVFCRCRI